METGAAGVMVAPPSSLRTDDQIAGYFRNASETLGPIPWVLQDFPLATGVQIAPSVCLRILPENPTCVMLRHEDWPGLEKISALRRAEADGARRASILCGNGGLFLLEEMSRGADGAMTGFAYPGMMADVVALVSRGQKARARESSTPTSRSSGTRASRASASPSASTSSPAAAPSPIRPCANGPRAPGTEPVSEIDTLTARQEEHLAALA